jgi:2-keto-4-pentenoate hydratase
MQSSAIRSAAEALLVARRTSRPIPPLVERFPEATIVDAYRIQQEQVESWTRGGDDIRGHKIGLVSAAIRRQMGIDQPDYGHLTASMFYPEDDPLPTAPFIQPRIEAEIAFVLKRPLRGPGVTVVDAARAVEHLLPALEIVDSRIANWNLSIVDTIADNASSGAVILGGDPTRLSDVDLRHAGCVLTVNGAVVETGAGAAVLGSPLNAVAWLANAVGLMGVTLEPGHVVLSGAMTRAVPIAPGDTVSATIAGAGTVTTRL